MRQVMKEFIDDHFLFWMGSILNPEAYSVSVRVRACGFPYVAVMTTATEDGSPYPTVCDANEGIIFDSRSGLQRATQTCTGVDSAP